MTPEQQAKGDVLRLAIRVKAGQVHRLPGKPSQLMREVNALINGKLKEKRKK